MSDVVRDERTAEGNGVRCDQHVELSNGGPAFGKDAPNSSELSSGSFVERHDLHRRNKRIDQPVQLPRPLTIRTVPKLGERDRADTKVGARLQAQLPSDLCIRTIT